MLLFDPTQGRLEEDIGAEAFGLDNGVIVKDDIIEISILLIGWKIAATALE
jgi:hypothetical protein